MKIGIITSCYPEFQGDVPGNFLHLLSKEITRHGHQIKVIAPYIGDKREYELDGIKVFRFNYFWPKRYQLLCGRGGMSENIREGLFIKSQIITYSLAILVNTYTKLRDCDLIHVHWPVPHAIGAIFAKKILRIPFINTIHGAEVYVAKRYHFNWALRMSVRQSAVSTVNSTGTLKACLDAGCKKDRFVLIYGGVDTDFYRPQLVKKKASRFEIISVGSLIERKGHEYLLEAFSDFAKTNKKSHLTIIGFGPREKLLKDRIKKGNLENQVTILTSVSNEKLLELYNRADLFVLSSVKDSLGDTEGMGTVFLEAMACKLPVIGTKVGGIPDIVHDKKNGLLVAEKDTKELAKAIEYLSTHHQERARLADEGYKMVNEKFNWSVIANRYLQLYDGLVEKKVAVNVNSI